MLRGMRRSVAWAVVFTLVALSGGAISRRAAGAPAARPSKADGGAGDLPVAQAGDCPAICAKLLKCKAGPFDTSEDCTAACEASLDDGVSAKTYRCAARARSCAAIAKCSR
jgi:hypothetical protein